MYTVNWEIFVVEIFSHSTLCTKIKRTKLICMYIININVHGKGRLYENYSTRKFIARNIFNTDFLQFTVCPIFDKTTLKTASSLVHTMYKLVHTAQCREAVHIQTYL